MTAVLPINALRDGQMAPVRVGDEEILICRVDGEYFALANRCSHASQALHTGRLRGYEIACPLHGARFDIRDGSCRKGPASGPVRSYRVWMEAGKVHVSAGRT